MMTSLSELLKNEKVTVIINRHSVLQMVAKKLAAGCIEEDDAETARLAINETNDPELLNEWAILLKACK